MKIALTNAELPDSREALEKSIEHWKRLAAGERQGGETHYYQSCALCALFIDNLACNGCPVADAGFPHCGISESGELSRWLAVDNIYEAQEAEFLDGHSDPKSASSDAARAAYASDEFRHEASKMVEFLESLQAL